jgi:hypothetical protein
VEACDWTSGFFPGALWYLYEGTGYPEFMAMARRYTQLLEAQACNRSTHDIGFMVFCSHGNGYRLTREPFFRDVALKAAETLATRFDSRVGCIKSWDEHRWEYSVIIDNMMNLELLFWASEETGQASFRNIAMSHADRTLAEHFRADGSCFHVVGYNPKDGSVVDRATHQGYSDASAWARGQAWALYGYTMCYRFTQEQRYLDVAVRTAEYLLGHPRMPEDLIPYWDFDDPSIPSAPRDASAGAIIASGLLELSSYVPLEASQRYKAAAHAMLRSLSSPAYLSEAGGNEGFLLAHSVGSMPFSSEVDVPLIYADYYFLEALLREARSGFDLEREDSPSAQEGATMICIG